MIQSMTLDELVKMAYLWIEQYGPETIVEVSITLPDTEQGQPEPVVCVFPPPKENAKS